MKIYELDYSVQSQSVSPKLYFSTREKAEKEKQKIFEAGKVLNLNGQINVVISEMEVEE